MLYLKLLTFALLLFKLCHSWEKPCDYFSRNEWTHHPSVAMSLYSIPDDFPRIPRPYLQHNLAPKLSLHHVIPHWLLKKFYNQVIRRNVNREINTLGTFLTHVLHAARRANHMLVEIYEKPFQNALHFTGNMEKYNARTSQTGVRNDFWFGEGWCVTMTFYTWLPGDLFFGPSPFLRTHDPESDFDTKAASIMEHDQYDLLLELFSMMKSFVSKKVPKNLSPEQAPPQEFYDIIKMLNKLVDHPLLYLYEPADWTRKKNF